tara:strand:- start:66 stop:518 length:453 start_codon:yes stop_codon:yes gene_type:complete
MLSFKDFMTADYTPGAPEQVSWNAHKRHRGRIGEETTDEALDFSQRRARARSMKKNKNRIAIGRKKAMKRAPSMEVVKKRANKAARSQVFKKLTKGVDKSDIPAARKQGLEKRLDKMKPRIAKLARRLLPTIRAKDKERRMSKNKSEDNK